ncbi:STAS-like domain-containing protein [Halomonas sp. DP1Y21-3]|uniref:STAS-like domain-containing protein n=1 Tax=unclassified Halomonas TaxID=2609666 RepID=UPI000A060A17|nr:MULTISPECIES: STAS-like domain-containing protein [unclassified Halomonas]MBY6109061.1 STAS-like domain-containing protein [Halomonas sp. DP1Y21-3]
MKTKTIVVVKDFHRSPFGRYKKQFGERSGQAFRENVLAPALRSYDRVDVILDGYNKYGRSFIDESFGGLIREEGFSYEFLKQHLTYSHDLVESFGMLIEERIKKAHRDSCD